jgi:DNA helicase INO80
MQTQYGLRRRPAKNKLYTATSPTPDGTPEPAASAEAPPLPAEDDSRLVSSDLDDCEEIWRPQIDAYAIDAHRRQKLVEAYFETTFIVSLLRWLLNYN